jgi:hypothetical protein
VTAVVGRDRELAEIGSFLELADGDPLTTPAAS